MKKVIYINYRPLTLHVYNHFFFDYLISNGIAVEYWEVNRSSIDNLSGGDEINSAVVRRINDKTQFSEAIRNENKDNTIFIILPAFGWHSLWIYWQIERHKCHTGWFGRLGLPVPKPLGISKIYWFLDIKKADRFFKTLLERLSVVLKKICKLSEPQVVFISGHHFIKNYERKSEIIAINHFDYDDYLLLDQDIKSTTDNSYAVFLDENAPYHPDFPILGMQRVEPLVYYQGLNKFFDIVEKKYGTKIVIAAHPSSRYKTDVFSGREMHKYKTNELVMESRFVLAHGSTALSFAVLHHKPVIFLYNDQFEDIYELSILRSIKNLSTVLGGSIYNVDKIQGPEEITLNEVDVQLYESYKYENLTSPKSEERLTKDLFLEYLKTN